MTRDNNSIARFNPVRYYASLAGMQQMAEPGPAQTNWWKIVAIVIATIVVCHLGHLQFSDRLSAVGTICLVGLAFALTFYVIWVFLPHGPRHEE